VDLTAGFAGVSVAELVLVAAAALLTSLIGGVTGYGTGVLMPLVLVPIAGAEAVVPIIAITALFTNSSRALAFRDGIEWRRAAIILGFSTPTCIIGAYAFTRLTGRGALILIGATLVASVPVRRFMAWRGHVLGTRGLALGSVGYGLLVGGTTGSGIILISMLMASGLTGAAVIATDAVISIALGVLKVVVFGINGVVTVKIVAFALLIGVIATPGAFIAKALVDRLPVHIHTAMLDGVILFGGGYLLLSAVLR
jgi:uncharacterized membrane protein YfcA